MSNTTQRTLDLLRRYESRNVTFIDPDGSWPIVWQRARGSHVWDAEGRRYIDLTAAFGVAAAGHANPRVVRAGQKQMAALLHAMGDVHPHPLKAQLARELSRITFERWPSRRGKLQTAKTILCNSGFEAVEAALKTALLVTGKSGVIAFEGAYHGLGYGSLNATHRDHFRAPFKSQLAQFSRFVPFPQEPERPRRRGSSDKTAADVLEAIRSSLEASFAGGDIGAVLVEPIQARGGIRIPPRDFLLCVRQLCNRHGALLILDEIYTGFGRTGAWFACEHTCVIPDIICLGKALTGGFPLSACTGRADVMDAAWPPSTGEAIHTSTFLGHPVGCTMALAQIAEIGRLKLVARSRVLGKRVLELLRRQINMPGVRIRGLGLMAGIEIINEDRFVATDVSLRVIKEMLRRGFILLPEGDHANVISLTPPLTMSERDLSLTISTLADVLRCYL